MKRHRDTGRARRQGAIALAVAAAIAGCGAGPVRADTIPLPAGRDEVLVPLPDGAGAGEIIVELDGYDVTALVERTDGGLLLPARGLDLEPGAHELRLLATNASGDIDTLAEHVLDVRIVERTSRARSNLLLGSIYRIDEDPAEDFAGVRKDDQRALLEVDAEVAQAQWALRAAGGAIYDSARETSPENALWSSPAYELQAERTFDQGAASVTLGDDRLPFANLLFNDFARRGLRADASALGNLLRAQAFTLYSDPRTRLEDVLPSGEEERAMGGYATISPLARHPQWLQLTGGYVDGQGTLGGATISTVDPDTLYGGDAWNAALDSWTFGNALWMHVEYASSRFDSDGIGQGAGERDDDARQFAMQLASGGAISLPGLDEWALGWQHQVVGANFFSIGNLLQPGDLSLNQGYLRLGLFGLSVGAEVVSQHSDVDDDPLRPRHDSKRRALLASYTPLHIDPQAGIWRVLGTPTLSAEFEQVDFEQPDSDALVAGFDLDSELRTSAFGIDFAGATLSFGVRYSDIRFDDRSQAIVVDDFPVYEPQADTHERTIGVQLAWTPNPRFMLAPQVQRSRLTTDGVSGTSYNDLWGLQCQAELVSDRLWLQASYSETSDEPRPIDPLAPVEEFTGGGGAANLVYRMYVGRSAWPSIDWQLGGHYASTDLQDSWQVHLGFELSWRSGAE
ncbi:MAG TPA: hypothetical protein VFR59_02035 [Steroidobacteraceae bacterium]|nr:hypothetical protein [Steroidobacteraceae bacterium]